MSFATVTLEGYLTKCGAPEYDASLVASLFGESYTVLNAHFRTSGAASESKARAAISICRGVFIDNGGAGAPLLSSIKGVEDIKKAIRILKAAGICRVAVHAYAFHEDQSDSVHDHFEKVIEYVGKKGIESGIKESLIPYTSGYKNELDKTVIGCLAIGNRKGFFSKIFG